MIMGQITDIQQQKRKEGRVSVYIDQEFWTGMPADVAGEHDLRIGHTISDDKKSEIERQIAEEAAMGAATNLLSYRDRSEAEMRRRLQEKGFGESVIDQTISRLSDYNYLDDQAFALQLAGQQLARGKGERAASYALRQAGLSDDLIAEALAEVYSAGDEEDAAVAWLSSKPLPQTSADRQKLLRGLASRGFSFDVAQQALTRHESSAS